MPPMLGIPSPPALTLLVIDDEATLCDYVADIAQEEGFVVHACSDPGGVATSLRTASDVIFLDLMMPGVDGVEVLRMAADAGCAARIVLMSGIDSRMLNTAQRFGISRGLDVCATVHKPVRAAELRALLRTLSTGSSVPGTTAPRLSPALAEEITAEDLARGIAAGELVLHYQPQVALSDGRWEGIEALVRWQHPKFGLVMPNRFIQLAEREELALALTRAVVERALSDLRPSAGEVAFEGVLSLNLPAVALTDLELPNQMHALAGTRDWPDSRIQFELTETSAGSESPTALDILLRLRMSGFCLSIDDFGTGHSSLQRLRLLPFTELKIDIQFVRGLASDPVSAAIVRNSIALAHQLGIRTVAEGVEDAQAWRLLHEAGCDLAQGYFISRPVPLESLSRWKASWLPPAARATMAT